MLHNIKKSVFLFRSFIFFEKNSAYSNLFCNFAFETYTNPFRGKVWVDILNKGVIDALILTYLNLASSNVCQEQSNVNASQSVLYIVLIGFEL